VHRRLTLTIALPLLALAACSSSDGERTVALAAPETTAAEAVETTLPEGATPFTSIGTEIGGEATAPDTTVAPATDTTIVAPAAPVAVPEGFTLVDRSASGYTVAVPADWTTMSAEDFLANAQAGADMLELDPSMQQLATAALSGADVFAAINPATGANVNVLVQPGAAPITLLTSVLQKQYTDLGAANVVVDDSQAAAGRLLVTADMFGLTLHQLAIFTDDSIIFVTVTNASPEVTDAIIASVQTV
jgi:hypothetical protein